MTNNRSILRTVLPTIVAVGFMLASGQGYRLATARLANVATTISIPSGTLAQLPLSIQNWIGEEAPLDEAIIKRTDTEDHVNRVYRRSGGREAIAVFFAYGVRMRDLLPHRPEVCYPGAGWTMKHAQVVELDLTEDRRLPCRIYEFHQGALAAESVTVLNYFIVDGMYHADVSDLRSKSWTRAKVGNYVARVQITSLTDFAAEAAEEMVRRFAVDSADSMRNLITETVNDAMAAQTIALGE